ncbi:MAG: DUF3417 domain-containing protein, partial [Actinomycetota bacterium]|nr:DUF3417 domain-containing protein [Actinomycetota bacterium]
MSFAEHGGGDLQDLAGNRLRRASAAVQDRLDVENGNPANHHRKVPCRARCHAPGHAVDPADRPARRAAGPAAILAGGGAGSAELGLVSLSVRAIRRFTIRPALPEPLAPLRTLMLNLRWSWHEPVRALFAEIDA